MHQRIETTLHVFFLFTQTRPSSPRLSFFTPARDTERGLPPKHSQEDFGKYILAALAISVFT
ncbi:hypothetical protein CBOM_07636 [Ceraceosorus bombacis]|uniref:Uncharacterized protein n=1 Tax=Ceraceosorus bombacis TaxID=401625 RepID=A0A0P1BKQ6_9BASI|nr:hypothetical protein CBOM_07636 [Ceraceosorus bombacis]